MSLSAYMMGEGVTQVLRERWAYLGGGLYAWELTREEPPYTIVDISLNSRLGLITEISFICTRNDILKVNIFYDDLDVQVIQEEEYYFVSITVISCSRISSFCHRCYYETYLGGCT